MGKRCHEQMRGEAGLAGLKGEILVRLVRGLPNQLESPSSGSLNGLCPISGHAGVNFAPIVPSFRLLEHFPITCDGDGDREQRGSLKDSNPASQPEPIAALSLDR